MILIHLNLMYDLYMFTVLVYLEMKKFCYMIQYHVNLYFTWLQLLMPHLHLTTISQMPSHQNLVENVVCRLIIINKYYGCYVFRKTNDKIKPLKCKKLYYYLTIQSVKYIIHVQINFYTILWKMKMFLWFLQCIIYYIQN